MKVTVPARVTPSTAEKVKQIMEHDPEEHLTRIQVYSRAVDALHKKIFHTSTIKRRKIVGDLK